MGCLVSSRNHGDPESRAPDPLRPDATQVKLERLYTCLSVVKFTAS